ncbi:MAG: hypothetical protein JWN70_3263 [Planctomycetaceae bacterium]|nr:hypothetical protein [Planctomycetaceae bacterium]
MGLLARPWLSTAIGNDLDGEKSRWTLTCNDFEMFALRVLREA